MELQPTASKKQPTYTQGRRQRSAPGIDPPSSRHLHPRRLPLTRPVIANAESGGLLGMWHCVTVGAMGPVLCPVVVGRDNELRLLAASLDAACEGRGGAIVLSGEAGIGKTRLVARQS